MFDKSFCKNFKKPLIGPTCNSEIFLVFYKMSSQSKSTLEHDDATSVPQNILNAVIFDFILVPLEVTIFVKNSAFFDSKAEC